MDAINWKKMVRERFESMGWEALSAAQAAFGRRMEQFLKERGLAVVDDNPEGHDWVLLLRNGTELYVERRSYDTNQANASFWVEYRPEDGGVVADFYDAFGNASDQFVIVPNEEIAESIDDW
jgi:hypothetical protein